ncbi:hypothetical protein SASPL_119843 [Salvia splendens]|uniref:RING-type domain-containing protein n=1 Tax=Salvia splendens TaxID=180675 RepID=A0A8X8ZVM5_SALSN|nr:uncharacterized protein LOC121811097 [Salvia splendens]XP_042067828.1 uncharacterized protein LOC121811097 [Salvia splendens]XP_042067829.1 uncharacterized protein LOC121811097 [Salvia splendens]KAG6417659.1 hypothetical protein SASPL_119843 [Salvia splendens]
MAVAGLRNVPDFAPRSFIVESQKRDSGRWDDDRCRRSTRASTLLQMWRQIEGEHVLSESYRSRLQSNGSDSECRSIRTSVRDGSENGDAFSPVSYESENQAFSGSDTEHDDDNSVISEQSSELGEVERERVRQIFQGWMNSCPRGDPSYGSKRKNRAPQCASGIESERVKILWERAENTTQPRSLCTSSGAGAAEFGSQTVHSSGGLVVNHPEIGARRPLRRLCGRQTLHDLLLKTQSERKRELLSLSEQKPVSDFAHRNRIQALLRGRFLRNGLVGEERPSSKAATELGFLRQRQTVSDLREGFLSKLDNTGSAVVNSSGCDSCCNDGNKSEAESACIERGDTGNQIAADLEGTTADGNRNMQELEVQIDEAGEPVLVDERSQDVVSVCAKRASSVKESVFATEARQHGACSHIEDEDINITFSNESEFESADLNCSGPSYDSINVETSVRAVDDSTSALEGNINEEFDSHDALDEESQVSVTEIEESIRQNVNNVAFTERDSDQSFPGPSGDNVEEQDQMQETHDWPSHDFQEAIDSWLDMPYSEAGESVREVDTTYFPDDGNANSMELRELYSRRRVSSLLDSSFRESLNQVLLSHVERLENASYPQSEEDPEQLDHEQSLAPSESAERNPFMQSSTLFEASQQLWNDDLEATDSARHYLNQQFGTEWEVINELRMDMARLQQGLNNMQGMLEACIDMQIELQRSFHQEVSAALNRPVSSGDVAKDNQVHDESQWDHVKRGICCLCEHSKIDSLFYRCGHMCTCTNCAENLVQSKGKCPMCCAPAVEAVCAYFAR